MFKAPKPVAPVVVDPPKVDDPSIQAGVEAERLRRQKAQGRQSTLVSSLSGALDDSGTTSRKTTLLGG